MSRLLRTALLTLSLGLLPVAATAQQPREPFDFVIGLGPGTAPKVKAYTVDPFFSTREFDAYENSYRGGISVAVGDVNADGREDFVTGPGADHAPWVRAFNFDNGAIITDFLAYEVGFRGGVTVTAGDLNADGRAEIVTAAGVGGSQVVKIFNNLGQLQRSFVAYGDATGFVGGPQLAIGDYAGDGVADIIVGSAAGGAPSIKVFSGADLSVVAQFAPFDLGFTGGVNVATGRFGGVDALIVGAGAGGAPQVRVYSLEDFSLLRSFLAFDADFRGGVNVAGGVYGEGEAIYVAMASQGSQVAAFDAITTGQLLARFYPLGEGFRGGLKVAAAAMEPRDPIEVPEPATWMQLIAGFGLGGSALRLRRRAAA